MNVTKQCFWVASVALAATGSTASAAKVYWSDDFANSIQRANLDGTGVEFFMSSDEVDVPNGLVIDPDQGMIYWVDQGRDEVRKASLDDGTVTTIVSTDIEDPQQVAFDPVEQMVYWVDVHAHTVPTITRVSVDGSLVEDVTPEGLSGLLAQGIALDVCDRKMYFSNGSVIQGAELDGTSVFPVESDLTSSNCLAMDPIACVLYWANGEGEIWRKDLVGDPAKQLVVSGLTKPVQLTVDYANRKIYWTDQTTIKVQRANLDGTEVEDIVTAASADIQKPWGVAIDPTRNRPGDFDDDGDVDLDDQAFFASYFDNGEDCLNGDANKDGAIDPLDTGYVMARFGGCPE